MDPTYAFPPSRARDAELVAHAPAFRGCVQRVQFDRRSGPTVGGASRSAEHVLERCRPGSPYLPSLDRGGTTGGGGNGGTPLCRYHLICRDQCPHVGPVVRTSTPAAWSTSS